MRGKAACCRRDSRTPYLLPRRVWLVPCLTLTYAVVVAILPQPFGLMRLAEDIEEGGKNDACAGADLCICPRPTICADTPERIVYLLFSRASAYFDYPLYVLLFLTKTKHLNSRLQQSVLSLYIPFHDADKIHKTAGVIVGVEVFWHAFWHLVRWALRDDDIRFLWETRTGITGFAALVLTPIIVLPMTVARLKKAIKYEWRKWCHYLSIIWGLALCLHAPATHVLHVMGSVLLLFMVDSVYGLFACVHFIPCTKFRRLETFSEMSFIHPKGFEVKGPCYILVCLPWLSAFEWHAFSLFPDSQTPGCSTICIASVGDWTRRLHKTLGRPTSRPAWLAGPYGTPFAGAVAVDNAIAVASGIGITPALSLLRALSGSRTINLVWICADACLLEFYLKAENFPDHSWTLVYYTGKRPLNLPSLPETVIVSRGRPDLSEVLPAIMNDVETGVGLESVVTTASMSPVAASKEQIALASFLLAYSHEEIFKEAAEDG
eukprot:TRINITY_DN8342_c0_g2_i1.p1 TRINITY_DN8342_c0_g2~~TRINITY_DN8342_c0_g2_i1.p1  ORF type:complete len:491 (-),score=28.31 TRINITY_DN8342_c0_g2_i1:137-1609(-)